MPDKPRKSRRKRDLTKAVILLAAGESVRAAAVSCGVCEDTLYRRLRQPEFREQVRQARIKFIDDAASKIGWLTSLAVATLGELLENDEPANVRLSAARAILDHAPKLHNASMANHAVVTPDQVDGILREIHQAVKRAIPDETARRDVGAELAKIVNQRQVSRLRLQGIENDEEIPTSSKTV